MNKKMIQMMMVLGLGGVVMFASQSQALSLSLGFSSQGVSVRVNDDKRVVVHHDKGRVLHRKFDKRHDDRKCDFRDNKHKDKRQFERRDNKDMKHDKKNHKR